MWLVLFAAVAPFCVEGVELYGNGGRMLQAIRGERVVGQMLEELRADGYKVFHDLTQEGYNVDHVLVGPGGVFAVETKTWSKPATRKAEVHFDGEHLLVDGFAPERCPVRRRGRVPTACGRSSSGRPAADVPVRPVVLFPSWWVNSNPKRDQTWVLNPKLFVTWMKTSGGGWARPTSPYTLTASQRSHARVDEIAGRSDRTA